MFIRYGVAFEIAARVLHMGLSPKGSAGCPPRVGGLAGRGGGITVGRTRAPALPFNMYRSYVLAHGKNHTAIWEEPHQEW